MHSPRLSRLSRVAGLSIAAALLLMSGVAVAQQLIAGDEISQFVNKSKTNFQQKVLGGQEPVSDKLLEQASRYYVLRLTMVENSDPKKMYEVVHDFETMASIIDGSKKNNRDVVGKFAPHVISRFKEIFALDFKGNSLVLVNAATMLPSFARFRQDAIGDYLASIVADEKMSDAIRVHAAKGMREYFPAAAYTKLDLGNKQSADRKTRDMLHVDALAKLIDRPMPYKPVDQYEVDGLRYVRAEAVGALSQARVPAISAYTGKVEAPVALNLIKVLAKKIEPEPNIRERLEAAIGVCHFSKYPEEYDPRIGVYLVGQTLIDFLGEYRKDFNNIQTKGKERKPTYLPWKIEAKRLDVALDHMVNNLRGTPSANSAQMLEQNVKPMLKLVYTFEALDSDLQLRNAVQKLRPTGPTAKVLFKDAKNKALLEYDWEPAAAPE